MKKKEWEKLQQLTVEELVARENELKAELFNLRFQHATGQLTNPMRLKECKREIARVKRSEEHTSELQSH